MRILLICPAFRCIGGIQEVVDNIGAQFHAAGHEVMVLTNRDLIGVEREQRAELKCIYMRIPESKPASIRHLERLVRHPRGTRELIEFLEAWRPHIVNYHVTSWDHIPAVTYACRSAGVPVIHSFHCTSARRQLGDRALEALKDSCGVTAVSDYTKRQLEQLSPAAAQASVIRSGVDLESAAVAPALRRERPYIFSAARLYLAHKAIDVLVDAFALIAPHHPDLDLLIAGDGSDREQLEALISRKRLDGRVHMLGLIQRRELWKYFKGAVMFAMPSRFADPMPLVFSEAMACGTAVIGCRTGGIPELVPDGEAGFLIERNEPEKLAAAMENLIANPKLRTRMGMQGPQIAARNSWPRVAEQYLEVYSRVDCNHARHRPLCSHPSGPA